MFAENEGRTGQWDPGTPLAVQVLGLDNIATAWNAVDVCGDALAEVEEPCRPRLGRRILGLTNGPSYVSGLSPLDEKVGLEDDFIIGLDLDGNLEDLGTPHYGRSSDQCEDKSVNAENMRHVGTTECYYDRNTNTMGTG